MSEQNFHEYAGIRITAKSMMAVDDGQPIMVVPLTEIESIRLCFGRKSERPLMQAAFSLLLLIIGLLPIFASLTRLAQVNLKLMMIAGFIPFGIWGLRTSFANGFYLEVTSKTAQRKLPLPTFFDPVSLRELITQCAEAHEFSYADDGVSSFGT